MLARHTSGRRLMVSRSLRPRKVEVTLQRIENAGKFVLPLTLLGVGPVTIQASGIGDVLRKCLPYRGGAWLLSSMSS